MGEYGATKLYLRCYQVMVYMHILRQLNLGLIKQRVHDHTGEKNMLLVVQYIVRNYSLPSVID